jgi:hypothetical protein
LVSLILHIQQLDFKRQIVRQIRLQKILVAL